MAFPEYQIRAIAITERLCSGFSLVGAAFIIATFLLDKSFHKPINRLVFYAAWGNVMANVATLISVSGIDLGVNGPVCQFQAFLIQWLIPADAIWTFAMACNVYFTFFRNYDAHQLRSLEWKYVLCCYGIPFIPAFTYCFIKSASRGKIYGSAVLWCWVALDWDVLRISTFYGPVWVVIFVTMAIYISTGRIVLKWRRQVLKFAESQIDTIDTTAEVPPIFLGITRKTEIFVTTELAPIPDRDRPSRSEGCTANASRSPGRPLRGSLRGSLPSYRAQNSQTRQSRAKVDANRAAVSYFKCSILFFVALLVTWVPSTVNRVYTLVHPDKALFGLDYASGLVLPLQGFWNATIYIVTSLPACKALTRRITNKICPSPTAGASPTRRRNFSSLAADAGGPTSGASKKRYADSSESIQELRGSEHETV